jgi:alpha-galactosidase
MAGDDKTPNPARRHNRRNSPVKLLAPILCLGSLLMTAPAAPLAYAAQTTASSTAPDISGTWVAHYQGPNGDTEVSWNLKVENGSITGTETLPFTDGPIVAGHIDGDQFTFTVQFDAFNTTQRRDVHGRIVGDTLELTPAVPQRPAPPAGEPARPSPPQPPTVVARRGTPTPNYRAPHVDWSTLPKIDLPALHPVPANGLAKTPPMGWNSWNKFRTKFDDKTVRQIADAMVSSGMRGAGYTYINIDDGWQGKRDAQGVLQPNPNFPDMKALADYVHSKGLKLGIYSSPGPRTCAGYEGSYGHEEIDAKTWAAWGIDYLKYDWCSAARVWKDPDMQLVYQRMGEALAKTGRPIVYALCQYGRDEVQKWGPEVGANLWRTTGDISDKWESMTRIGFNQGTVAPYAKPGSWNDPDMLEVGNGGMTTEEYRLHFSLWAMLAAPLIAGNDLRSMSPEIRSILTNKEVIAVDQDALGKEATPIAQDGDVEIYGRPLASGDYAVAFFNRGEQPAKTTLRWSNLQMGGKHAVRDLWQHANRGAFADQFATDVPAHGVVMIRVSK